MKFLKHKLLQFFLTILFVSAITFAMVDLLPGDAAIVFAGPEASVETVVAIRHEMGLDAPVIVRYFCWIKGAARGDFGFSLITREPVWDTLVERLPVTLELLLFAQMMALTLAIPAAMICASRPGGTIDRILTTVGFASLSIPSFVMAILLVFFFVLQLQWLPATSFEPLSNGLAANIRSLLLPGLSIALVEWVILFQVLRSDLITTLGEDFILMARSKGLSSTQVLFRHALRPSSLNLLTVVGLQMGNLIGGALVVETIFALPGIGRLLLTAIYTRDIFMIQGCVLWITLGYVVVNLFVDLLYAALDPRIRVEVSIE
ncbi:ABC transporter permease [Desulfogranum mediterraneum]|uniref:ABC transporter permease n=1 Tax=Desulfogranum mediterraneum TaxID=160661 RepID=UPI0003F5660F|nr:ABC transporter permease [Desulfogranum mediterraneum]